VTASRRSEELARHAGLTYDDFRRLAGEDGLSAYEKIGFPDDYRAGHEEAIFADLRAKVPTLDDDGGLVVDIGCGCSGLPGMLARHAVARGAGVVLIDSAEMLAALAADVPGRRVAGRFPDLELLRSELAGQATAVIVYSVLQYVLAGGDLHGFVDAAVALLAPGGHLLLGDIPNEAKRARFFASPTGVAYHRAFMGVDGDPEVAAFALRPATFDDGVLLGLLLRYRQAGFESYLVPQGRSLPMQNRREDLLIVRN
jgi:2-polyprenyl-3-methyl-5-hydroxy-6-metoxy-1,4-benzoquinol methylase